MTRLLELLLWADRRCVATFLLSAIRSSWMKTSVTFAADHFVTIVFLGQQAKSGLDDTTSETEDQVEGGLLLDVVIRKSAAVFQLLTSKD